MKIAILTTDTLHHLYYVQQLSEHYKEMLVVCENTPSQMRPMHNLDRARDQFEKKLWFDNRDASLNDFENIFFCNDVNEEKSIKAITDFQTDIVLIFGTGLISTPLIDLFPDCIFNLHGGNPEYYRGLDSHFWTIMNKDWNNLVTTMHRVEIEFDTGEIVEMLPLPTKEISSLYQLRSINTEICLTLSCNLFEKIDNGTLDSEPQKKRGKYYSAFPEENKSLCMQYFEEYTRSLNNEA